MPAAIGLYSVIKALHPGKNGPDDYVFLPQFDSREHAMSTMTKQFTEALKLANLKFDHAGKKRDLYSLRHTCISRAILMGIPIADVARNAGTSVDMIERFYASHLRSEMSVERFHKAVPHVQEVGSTLEDLFMRSRRSHRKVNLITKSGFYSIRRPDKYLRQICEYSFTKVQPGRIYDQIDSCNFRCTHCWLCNVTGRISWSGFI